MASSDPYSASRVTRGVAYLVIGKIVTSVAGIGTFLLLVRALPVEQFAAYTVLFALVEIVEAITGVGLSHVVSRYVPELYVQHRKGALRRLVAVALAMRLLVLGVFLAIVYLLAPTIAPLIGLTDWEWAVKAYLLVVLARVTSASMFGVLESMLHQKISQMGAAFVTVTRFALLALTASQGMLELRTVIVIELVTDLVGCTIMLIGIVRAMSRAGDGEPSGGSDWIRSNLGRMAEFGIKGYLQHLLIMPYGGSTNRLLVGGSLATADVALFGFAQSVADLMERYLPVKLLAGVIRPVLAARYARDRRFSDVGLVTNLIFKVNLALICAVAVAVFAGGESLMSLVTAGKYSEGGVGLLLLMCALVVLYSLRHMLDHVCHAVERNGPLIMSNAVITCSILPGIALLPTLGVYALPAANLVGLVIGSAILLWKLHTDGFELRRDVAGLSRVLVATAAGFGAGEICRRFHLPWGASVAAGVGAFACALILVRPVSQAEREILGSLIKRR
jgi:O-antigen/teichoic acid export membrane protein